MLVFFSQGAKANSGGDQLTFYARLVGWGKYLPKKVVTNDDLAKIVDTSDEWIVSHTGIRERRVVADDETTVDMAFHASQEALKVAGLAAKDLDLIILATSSPDYQVPSGASVLQGRFGAKRAAAFDLRAGCSGFIYGLATASQFIATGTYRNALVVGAEIISKFMDWTDRRTCVLFGDGAGAVVLQASREPCGVLSFDLGSDGENYDALYIPAGGSAHPFDQEALDKKLHRIRMDGKRILRFAAKIIGPTAKAAVAGSGLHPDEIDLLIPQQSSARFIEYASRRLHFPLEKIFVNVDHYANTSAASVPIALCEAFEQGRIREGDNVLLLSFGAGLTWASAVVSTGVSREMPIAVDWPLARFFENVREVVEMVSSTAASALSALLLPFFTRNDRR